MKDGKNFKIWGVRSDLIGDQIMALPILTWLEKQKPNSYKYWSVLRKCSQAAPLYFNHPLIDKIVISDLNEGFGDTDKFYKEQCDIVFDTRPQHPFEQDWHNFRNMYEETWVMAGLPIQEWNKLSKQEQTPKLFKWFDIKKENKTIFIHCFAGYGRDKMRSPSKEWWENLIPLIIKLGYKVIRLGHENEPLFDIESDNYKDTRSISFIEQVKLSISGNLYIGTDSGMSLICGAYNEMPHITLLTNWNNGHVQNFFCLAPNNDKNINLFAKNGCDNIQIDEVVDEIKHLI